MGYRYETMDDNTEIWERIKPSEVRNFKMIRIIDATNDEIIIEGSVKEVNRLYVKDEFPENAPVLMNMEIEFNKPPPLEEVTYSVFPSTSPPWQGK